MTCAACKVRGWRKGSPEFLGSDPRCAFPDGGSFNHDNWNCATMNALRDLADSGGSGVNRHYYCDGSQSVALIDVYDCDLGGRLEDNAMAPGFVLFLTWYKSRGCTEGAWLISDKGPPVAPNEAQALATLKAYGCEPQT